MHICSTSAMTLGYSALFKSASVCRLLGVPYLTPEKNVKNEWQELVEWYQDRKTGKKASVSPASLRIQDMKEFENAGRKRPIVKK